MSKNADEADGKKYTREYENDKIYIVVLHETKEVFISSIDERIPNTAAMYDSLTRMITMAWQHNDVEDIIKQLLRSSRSKKDLPGILADLLAKKDRRKKKK